MLTPRENFIRFFRNEPCQWTPTSMDQLQFRPAFIPDHVARGMVVQQEPYTGPFGGKDLFGVEWTYDEAAGGSMEVAPLFEDIEDWKDRVSFPELDSMDWEGCARDNAEYLKTDKIIFTTIYTGYFERLISFVGFENAAMALIDEEQQEEVHRLFDRLSDLYIELIRRLHRYFNVEIVEIHDDWGTQKSTMFSPDTHREMILPYLRKVAAAAHEEGVFIEQHSCGKIEELVPNLIDSGVDTWRGQAIVDKQGLVDKYGDRFKFGVEIRPAGPLSDEAAMKFTEQIIGQYRGRRIWLALARTLSPAQKEAVYGYIRALGTA